MAMNILKHGTKLQAFSASRFSPICTRAFSDKPDYRYILTEVKGENKNVGMITLNRPKALNALCDELINELNSQLNIFDQSSSIGAIVITGNERAFAAGADIKEMNHKTFPEAYKTNMLAHWNDITKVRTPVIAAVNGFALGGGCEVAMMCDIIIAGKKATFGQPEVTIGTIPGCGGTQRLIRAIGKSKAMEMILTGNFMNAEDAEKAGLVSRVVEDPVQEAVELGSKIASLSQPVIAMAKEAVNSSYENTLEQGVTFEQRLFHSTFGFADQKEGMSAFSNKKKPEWSHA